MSKIEVKAEASFVFFFYGHTEIEMPRDKSKPVKLLFVINFLHEYFSTVSMFRKLIEMS